MIHCNIDLLLLTFCIDYNLYLICNLRCISTQCGFWVGRRETNALFRGRSLASRLTWLILSGLALKSDIVPCEQSAIDGRVCTADIMSSSFLKGAVTIPATAKHTATVS